MLDGKPEQGPFNGISGARAVRGVGIVAQHPGLQQDGRKCVGPGNQCIPHGFGGDFLRLVTPGIQQQPVYAQGIFRKGTRLVGQDHIRGAEGLYSLQILDDNLSPCKAQHPLGQGDGRHDRKPFRNGGDGQGHPGFNGCHQSDTPQVPDPGNGKCQEKGEPNQSQAQPAKLLFQGGAGRFCRNSQGLDLAEFRICRCAYHQSAPASREHYGAFVQHVFPLNERGSGREDDVPLEDGSTFPGQDRFLHAELLCPAQPQVGRDQVAGAHYHQIAGNQVGCPRLSDFARAAHTRACLPQNTQGFEGAVGLPFHKKTNGHRKSHHHENGGGFPGIGEQVSQYGG